MNMLAPVLLLIFVTLIGAQDCGPGLGSCPPGQCCSASGLCGTTEDYCKGPDCQLYYSDSCDAFFPPSGQSTADIQRPRVGNVPYGILISECMVEGTIALTFDDGPWIYTSQLLDVLESYNVTATFFVVGNNLGKGHIDDPSTPWPAVLQRIHGAGHQIGSHSWTHQDFTQMNSTLQQAEVIYNEMAFRNLFGWFPTYFRCPYLACTPASGCFDLLNNLGYHIINMNIDTKDYMNDAADLIQNSKNTFSNDVSNSPAYNSYIPLTHDIHYQTVINLTAFMIETLFARGYKPTTVGECLGDPPANWYRDASGTISGNVISGSSSYSSPSIGPSISTSTSTLISISTLVSTSITSGSVSISSSISTFLSTSTSISPLISAAALISTSASTSIIHPSLTSTISLTSGSITASVSSGLSKNTKVIDKATLERLLFGIFICLHINIFA